MVREVVDRDDRPVDVQHRKEMEIAWWPDCG